MSKLTYKLLSDCVRSLSGGTPPKSNDSFWSGDLPWVSSGEMGQSRITDTELHITQEAGENHSKIVPAGTVLVVVRGMSLAKEFRVSITQREMAFNQDLKALIAKENVNSLFLFYSLYGRRFEICKLASESAHGTKKLDTKVLDSIPVFLPALPTQQKIAAIVSAYDDLIENNDRRITLLEKMAEEIYREWFVRLRFPGFDRATFHKGIPEGWELKSIQDACYVGDGAHASVKRVDDGIPYLTTKNFKSDGLSLSTVDYISAQEYKKYFGGENKTVKTPRKGDILMGIIGSFGQPYLVDSDDEFGISSSVAILRPNLERILPSYLYAYTRSTSFLEAIHLTKSGSAQGFLSLKMIGTLPLLLPPVELQKRFVDILQPILDSMKIMKNQRMILSQTRDRLLTRLISGKLSVEDLDIQFPPSMTIDP